MVEKSQDYLVFLSETFANVAREEYAPRLRDAFHAIKPAVDKVLEGHKGIYRHGGCDFGIEGAPGQYCNFMLIQSNPEAAIEIRRIRGVGLVITNGPAVL